MAAVASEAGCRCSACVHLLTENISPLLQSGQMSYLTVEKRLRTRPTVLIFSVDDEIISSVATIAR